MCPAGQFRVKKAGGHIGWNVVEKTIKMKTIVLKPLMIKIIKLHLRNLNYLYSHCFHFSSSGFYLFPSRPFFLPFPFRLFPVLFYFFLFDFRKVLDRSESGILTQKVRVSDKLIRYFDFTRCPWCNGYRRRKWTRRHELKSSTRLIAFHIALIPLGKVWIQ